MSTLLKLRQVSRQVAGARYLAMPTSGGSAAKPQFSNTLDNGPSLDDFIAGNVQEDSSTVGTASDRIVLGNTKR